MAYTLQQKALDRVQSEFGESGFTEDHIGYRRVGTREGGRTLTAIGETWGDAIEALREKVSGE